MGADVTPRFKEPRAKPRKGRARPGDPLAQWCEYPDCGRRATERHHKLRRSQGGTDDKGNTMDCCSIHHSEIHANPARSYENGWLIRKAAS